MEIRRKIKKSKSLDFKSYNVIDLNMINDFGINTGKLVGEEETEKIYEIPRKFYNKDYFLDEK